MKMSKSSCGAASISPVPLMASKREAGSAGPAPWLHARAAGRARKTAIPQSLSSRTRRHPPARSSPSSAATISSFTASTPFGVFLNAFMSISGCIVRLLLTQCVNAGNFPGGNKHALRSAPLRASHSVSSEKALDAEEATTLALTAQQSSLTGTCATPRHSRLGTALLDSATDGFSVSACKAATRHAATTANNTLPAPDLRTIAACRAVSDPDCSHAGRLTTGNSAQSGSRVVAAACPGT
mmetsp:Transcript_55637/g.131067  ORF Transcript_55637/g.131067 Transcript_55637/m.131067 type:complete len:240 (-) Transcript_55637:188-907(-)